MSSRPTRSHVIERFYDGAAEREWCRLDRHRVEYGITLRAMEQHLPPAPARVADIGGSVGRYSVELARRGYEMTLIDLSAGCLEFARARAGEAGVTLRGFVHADARDLSGLSDGSFDAVLLMGPLYHLQQYAERVRAVREAHRLLRPGGLVVAAFITRNSVISYAAADRPDYIVACRDELESIMATGTFRIPEGSAGFPDAWFCQPHEVPPLMCEGGFEQLDLLHCEPLVLGIETRINEAPEDLHRQWIDLLWRLCREPGVLGSGGHLLYVGRKA